MLCSGFALFALVDVRAARQPERHRAGRSVVTLEKRPDIVAKPPVPFLPAVADKAADLIEAGGVPGFGDQLDIGEDRVGFDVPEDRRRRHRAASSSRDRIEARSKRKPSTCISLTQ